MFCAVCSLSPNVGQVEATSIVFGMSVCETHLLQVTASIIAGYSMIDIFSAVISDKYNIDYLSTPS